MSKRAVLLTSLLLSASLLWLPSAFADGMPASSGDKTPRKPGAVGSQPIRSAGKPSVAPKTGNTQPLSEFELGRYQYCGQDSDCVVSINGCCDCVNGGTEVAVNKERLEDFRARFDCLHKACGDKLADPPCENGVVSCVNHKCQYYDDRPQESF